MSLIGNGVSNAISEITEWTNKFPEWTANKLNVLKNARNNTDVFQKTCQVAFAAIQFTNWYKDTNYLSKFTFVLSTVNMHDFYLIFKEPRQYFFPVTADSIDASAVLNDLVAKMTQQLPVGTPEAAIRTFAQRQLRLQLEVMASNQDAYRSVDEFKEVLQSRIRTAVDFRETTEDGAVEIYNVAAITLVDLTVPVVPTSLIERITNKNWLFVDIGCVALYFQGWNLLDTEKLANSVGKCQVLGWTLNQNRAYNWAVAQSLEAWVRGAVCTGYALKLYQASRHLLTEQLTEDAKTRERWDVITSTFELIYNGAGYLNKIGALRVSPGFIFLAAIAAKGLGIMSIMSKPKVNYLPAAAA